MTVLTDELRAVIKSQLTAAPAPRERENVSHYRYNNGRAHRSDALGVSPDQVDEYREHLRKHGIMADVEADGRVVIESEKQFRDIAKAGGLWSGRDGYGAKDSNGRPIMTGKDQAKGREELKRALSKMARGYPSDF